MIPKTIYYCWFGKKPLPNIARKCIASWIKFCPDYKIIKCDEKLFKIRNAPKYVKEAYKRKAWAFVSDYARLWCVFNYGGVYLDTDVELINSFDSLLNNNAFFGFESIQPNGEYYVNSGLGFGAIKGHCLISKLLDDYHNISFIKNDGLPDLTTCPIRNRHIFIEYGFEMNGLGQMKNNVVLLPPDFLCPTKWYSDDINITKNTLSIHHFEKSWINEKEREAKKVESFAKPITNSGFLTFLRRCFRRLFLK